MQDRFVGDIGDFGKYGLLRALTGIHPPAPENERRLSLGVVWCVPNKKTGAPHAGQNVGYLFDPVSAAEFQKYDEVLYDRLRKIVYKFRSLGAIERSNILGNAESVSFFNDPIYPDRNDWMDNALKCIRGKDIIFLDPDNGLATLNMEAKKHCSPEHVYFEELAQFLSFDQTIVIYQCFPRGKTSPKLMHEQMREWHCRLRSILSSEQNCRILCFTPGTPRSFIIVPSPDPDIACIVDKRLGDLEKRWGGHFTQLPSNSV